MLSAINYENINARTRALKYIFHIEDNIAYNILDFIIGKGFLKIEDFVALHCHKKITKSKFTSLIKEEISQNSSLKSSFKNGSFNISDYIEESTLSNLIKLCKMFNSKIKAILCPTTISWNAYESVLNIIRQLRNDASHSSLKSFDDLIYSKPQLNPKLAGTDTDKKIQFMNTFKNILDFYKSKIEIVHF